MQLTGLLVKYFKKSTFRDWQLHIIKATLGGKHCTANRKWKEPVLPVSLYLDWKVDCGYPPHDQPHHGSGEGTRIHRLESHLPRLLPKGSIAYGEACTG